MADSELAQDCDRLSTEPDWDYVYTLAGEQTVMGLVADGIGVAKAAGVLNISLEQSDRFLSDSTQIFRTNCSLNAVQQRLCQILEQAGIRYVILKGQGVGQCYPKPLLRSSGDIDFFMNEEDYHMAEDMLKPFSAYTEDKGAALECELTIEGVTVELHAMLYAGINANCQSHFADLASTVIAGRRRSIQKDDLEGLYLPSVDFDTLYILIHTIRHLGGFGISLRQVIDWMMHVDRYRNDIDWPWVWQQLEVMHLTGLWNLFMSFCIRYLGMNVPEGFRMSAGSGFRMASDDRLDALWLMIAAGGSFGKKSGYYRKLEKGRLTERYFRIYYMLQRGLELRKFDREFANFRIMYVLRDTFVAPPRFCMQRIKRWCQSLQRK